MVPRALPGPVLLLALVGSLGLPALPAPAAGAPAQLAVASPVRSTVQLTLVSADGLAMRRLTDRSGAVSQLSWAPDGQRIAFVYELQGARQIWLADLGGAVRALTALPGETTSPSWAPDGRRLAFISTRSGGRQVYMMGVDGRNVRQLTRHGTYRVVSWSPDGRTLAVVGERERGEDLDLYLMAPDGTAQRRINRSPMLPRPGMIHPAWAPDGRSLAFVSRVGRAEQEITIVSVDGRGRRRFSTGYAPAWSPDGRRMAFVVPRVGDAQVYVGTADGRRARPITRAGDIVLLPTWAPDGSALAVLTIRGGDLAVAVMRPDGSEPRRVLSTTGDLTGLPLFGWQPQ